MICIGQFKNGKWESEDPRALTDYKDKYNGVKSVLEIKPWKPQRSLNQNSYMWGVVYQTISNYTGMTPNEVHEFCKMEFNFGFKINYNPPTNVGIDRLIAAYTAVQKYGKPCIICDFGTATTIDVVNSENVYLGGIITAGLQLLADSLHQKTSKLPKIELQKPSKVIGDSTVSAIQSGVYFGYIGLVEGILQKMIIELGEKPKIIATGGLAKLISEGTKVFDIIDDNLMLEGLRILQKNLAEN